MPLVTFAQSNFTSGEMTPRLVTRKDLARYQNALSKLENFIVIPQGGALHRPGTRFVAEVKDSSRITRVINFDFNAEANYTIEFGHQYFRFYRDEGLLFDGPSPVEVASPYQEGQLRNVKYTQSADVLFLTHSAIRPNELRRASDVSWSLVAFDYQDGPYLDVNTTTTTLTPSAATGAGITITASAVTGINGDQGFLATDVDRLIRMKTAGTWGYAKIVSITSTTVVVADVRENLGGVAATADWRLGAWSDTTGWPFACEFHQERFWFGGTRTQPQTEWGSVVGDFTNFQPSQADGTVLDDDAVTFTLADDRVNAIRWMRSGLKGMVVGTSDAEFILQSRSAFDPITPTVLAAGRQTPYGSPLGPDAWQAASALLFVDRSHRRIREFAFNFDIDQYKSPDLTLLSEHIITGDIIETAFQSVPEEIFWCALDDGRLVGLTYLRDQEVVAWHKHIIGGSFGDDIAQVESIAISREDPEDQLWMVVKRTINGATKRYIEFMEDWFPLDGDKTDALFMDSALTYDGVATTNITGLDHLEGQVVDVLTDGAAHPQRTVSGGAITLAVASEKVHVGLYQPATLTTYPLFPERAPYDTRGKWMGFYKVFLEFHQTLGGKLGRDESSLDELVFREPSVPMGSSPELFTGIHEVSYPSGMDRRIQVTYQQHQPLPATLLGMIVELDLGGV